MKQTSEALRKIGIHSISILAFFMEQQLRPAKFRHSKEVLIESLRAYIRDTENSLKEIKSEYGLKSFGE